MVSRRCNPQRPLNDHLCIHLLLFIIYSGFITCTQTFPPLQRPSNNTSGTRGPLGTWSGCGLPPKWYNPLFQAQDCQGAVDWLFLEEMHSSDDGHNGKLQEFLPEGAKEKTRYKAQKTPRKYTFRKHSCWSFLCDWVVMGGKEEGC